MIDRRLAEEFPGAYDVELTAVHLDHRRGEFEDESVEVGLVGIGVQRRQHPQRACVSRAAATPGGALAHQPPDGRTVLVGRDHDQVVVLVHDSFDDRQCRVAGLDDVVDRRSADATRPFRQLSFQLRASPLLKFVFDPGSGELPAETDRATDDRVQRESRRRPDHARSGRRALLDRARSPRCWNHEWHSPSSGNGPAARRRSTHRTFTAVR